MPDDAQRIAEMEKRLDRLESQLAYLFRRMGFQSTDVPRWDASPRVLELVKKGDKTGAIRAFIEESGASLKDAKTLIESLRP